MKRSHTPSHLAALIILGAALTTPAHAYLVTAFDPNATTTLNYIADCVDCAQAANQETYSVTASLTVKGYVPNMSLGNDNFVSFNYGGSNLLNPFSITLV